MSLLVKQAIAELRTARRMTGDDSALPMIADVALHRPPL